MTPPRIPLRITPENGPRTHYLLFLLALTLVACGSPDATQSTLDTSVVDIGPAAVDSGVKPDAKAGRDAPCAGPVIKAPFLLPEFGVFFHLTVNGIGPFLVRYDVGSPASIMLDTKRAAALGLKAGKATAKIGELVLEDREILITDYFESQQPYPQLKNEILVGQVGNRFFADVQVGLDWQAKEFWFTKPPGPCTPLSPNGTEQPKAIPIDLPLSYVIVPCSFVMPLSTEECLLDTGAPTSLVLERYWKTVSHPSDRIVPTIAGDSSGALMEGYYQRAQTVSIGHEVSVPGDYVSVFAFSWFDNWCQQTLKRNIVGIVGLETYLRYYTVIDYTQKRLWLFPYNNLSHLFKSPFLGFGFVIGSSDGYTLEVAAVVPKSNAEAAGVLKKDVLTKIDGQSISTVMFDLSLAYIIVGKPGDSRSFSFQRSGKEVTLNVLAEDLLPP